MTPLGVGFLAAGPATQAIHLPALRAFADQLSVRCVMDVNAEVAQTLAETHGAAWTTDEDELISRPDVDIVVVGSPHAFHVQQITKACKAGKSAVLAEKPLVITREEAGQIRCAVEQSGARLVVGNMHAHDEAFVEAMNRWRSLDLRVNAVDVRCYLPADDELISLATELVRPSARPSAPLAAPGSKSLVSDGILGLAIHDIPLVREFVPSALRLDHARFLHPWGYFLQGTADDAVVRYVGMEGGEWQPDWSMQVIADAAVMRVRLQPSFVLPGSCAASITTEQGTWTWSGRSSPYEAEWAELLRLVQGEPARYDLDRVLGDVTYALDLVDQLDDVIEDTAV